MIANKGYILLTDTGTLFTKMIKIYTKKPYNHASITFNSKLSEVYSFGRKNVRNPFIGGFVKEDIHSSLFKQANCAIYSFEVTGDGYERMKQFIKDIETKEREYRYNTLGLLGFMMNRPIKRKNAFFCSQFVACVLKEGTYLNFKKPLSLIAPHDLQEIFNLQLVYEGKLKDYPHKNGDKENRLFCQPYPVSG